MTSKQLSRLVCLLGLWLLLAGCTSAASPSTPTASAPPPTSGVTVILTPSPTEPRLDPVPQHCPVSNPAPHMSLPGLGPVISDSPVWADWPPGGPVIAHLSHAPPGVYEAPYGWAILKTIWEVGPNYMHPVTVRGHDLFDQHTPLLIQFTDSPPQADTILDPQHPDHPQDFRPFPLVRFKNRTAQVPGNAEGAFIVRFYISIIGVA